MHRGRFSCPLLRLTWMSNKNRNSRNLTMGRKEAWGAHSLGCWLVCVAGVDWWKEDGVLIPTRTRMALVGCIWTFIHLSATSIFVHSNTQNRTRANEFSSSCGPCYILPPKRKIYLEKSGGPKRMTWLQAFYSTGAFAAGWRRIRMRRAL